MKRLHLNKFIIFLCIISILSIGTYIYKQKNKNFITNKEESINIDSENIDGTPIDILEKGVLNDGNIEYYHELQIKYLNRPFYDFLPWALIMANKHSCKEAYFDVFFTLCNFSLINDRDALSNYSLDDLDEETRKVALHYLQKSVDAGNLGAKKILGKYYIEGRYIKQNTELGEKLLKEAKTESL